MMQGVWKKGFYPFNIPYSCRFDNTRQLYMHRVMGVPTSALIWTFSTWLKISEVSSGWRDIMTWNNGATNGYVALNDNRIDLYQAAGQVLYCTPYYRDMSSWAHLLVTCNGSSVFVYWNGLQIGTAAGTMSRFNESGGRCCIGLNWIGNSEFFSGYLADLYFIDGQSLTPNGFGQVSIANPSVWIPKRYSGTYGANGFHLEFASPSALGTDTSGNGNNLTTVNMAIADQTLDTPTNNYPTINPLSKSGASTFTTSNGNLSMSANNGGPSRIAASQAIQSSDKVYFEFVRTDAAGIANNIGVGVCDAATALYLTSSYSGSPTSSGGNALEWLLTDNSVACNSSTYTNISGTIGTLVQNSVIMVAVNRVTGKMWFGRNGVWSGDPVAGTGAAFSNITKDVLPFVYTNQNVAGYFLFGQNGLNYTPPSGYGKLCMSNSQIPSIIDSYKYADAQQYTGSGSAQNITSFNFLPDLVWVKRRDGSGQDHILQDSVRGIGSATKLCSSSPNGENAADASATDPQWGYVSALLSNGFTAAMGSTGDQINKSSWSYTAWCWRKLSAAGLDVVSYAGNGSSSAIAHSLSALPHFMIIKDRNSGANDWVAYHKDANASPANGCFYLSTTAAWAASALMFNNTVPTTSNFSIGTGPQCNYNGHNFIAYLFTSIPGFSMFGGYIGNGSSDGPFVYCGFRPKFIIVKRTDAVADWFMLPSDARNYNAATDPYIYPNGTAGQDNSVKVMDILSNGFKLRTSAVAQNASGGTYIFAAWAEAPFRYANAR